MNSWTARGLAVALTLATACQGKQAVCAASGAAPGLQLRVQLVLAQTLPSEAADRVKAAVKRWSDCAQGQSDVDVSRADLSVPFVATHDDLAAMTVEQTEKALTAPIVRLYAQLAVHEALVVAVVPDIALPEAAASAVLPEASGLGIPAARAATAQMPWQRVLPAQRPALVLLSWNRMARLDADAQAALLGHELGHALGLGHDARRGNAMATGTAERIGWWDAQQAEQLRAGWHQAQAPGRLNRR